MHLSAIVVAVRGEAVWGAQVHHHVPLGPVIGGVSLEVSLMPHMVTSPSLGDHSHWPPPTSGTGSLQLKLTLTSHWKHEVVHCIHALLGVEKRRRRSDLCRYIWKCGFRHQSCKGDGKSTNFYSLLQFLLRTAVAVSDECWWWWHVTRDTWHWLMTRVPAARGHPCTQHCHHEQWLQWSSIKLHMPTLSTAAAAQWPT